MSLCVFSAYASAQYRFDNFTTNNGLPQNTVSAITQTRDGYLWFATYDGLVRYDGVRFTIFDKGNTPEIRGNLFLTVCGDKSGALWGGTNDGSLIRYKDGEFKLFTAEDGLTANRVGRVRCEDDGSILVFGGGSGEFLFRWDENKFVRAETQTLNEFVDKSNARWVLEKDKLVRFKNGQTTSFPITLSVSEFIRHRYEDSAGNLWLGTERDGVYHIAGDSLRHYTDNDGVPSNLLIKIGGEDREGNVWLYSPNDLIRYKDGRFTNYSESEDLKTRGIRAVFCDREGTIWIGTNGGGLFRVTREFLTVYSKDKGLPGKIVYPIFEDSFNNIWLGSGGVTKFVNGEFTHYPLAAKSDENPAEVFLSSKTNDAQTISAHSFYQDTEGRLLIGFPRGLLAFKDGRITNQSKTVNNSGVNVMLRDRTGNLWIGTNNGLYRERDGATTFYDTKNGLPDNRVIAIAEDKNGNLWFGTYKGLVKLEGDKLVSLTTKDGPAENRIRSLYADAEGALWIGTFDSGLSSYKDGRFTNYTTRDGLFNNGVFQILEDDRGNFWMSCNRGIYRVSRAQLTDFADGKISAINCVVYGSQDGMLSTECNGERQPAGIKTHDGKLWFPTQDGAVVIDPDAVPYNSLPPLPVIESVFIDGKKVSFKNGIQIEPFQNDLEINYTAPSSMKAEHIHFKYKLIGLNNEWIDAGTRRTVHYSHLPPGLYTFHVIAANSDGVWNQSGTNLAVDMKPYFYQTWLFTAICALIFLVSGPTIYFLRVHRLKVNEKKLTKLVEERTAELVEQTEQLEIANEKLEKLATLDGLTNIPNRRRFKEYLTHEWQRSQRQKTPLSVLLMDVDFFKQYNDIYGHQGGDECLKQVAAVLSETVKRTTDLAARYGGEEFVVVLTETDEEGALLLAEMICKNIESLEIPHSGSKVSEFVTISIGIAATHPNTAFKYNSPDDLIAEADRSLYRAKEAGRNRVWIEENVLV